MTTSSSCVPVLLLPQVAVMLVDTAQVTDVADAVGVIVTTQLPTVAVPVRTKAPVVAVCVRVARLPTGVGNVAPVTEVTLVESSHMAISPLLFCRHSAIAVLYD